MTLQTLLGIEYPIIQAPMAGVAGQRPRGRGLQRRRPGLAALRDAELDGMRTELAAIRAQTTRPFNVNFFCHAAAERRRRTRGRLARALSPYFTELGIDASADSAPAPGRSPFNAEAADVLEEFKPRRGELSLRPALERSAGAGAGAGARRSCRRPRQSTRRAGSRRTASTPSSRKDSRPAAIAACSCPTISSTQIGTLALVPQIVAAVKVPVIAAGGIADAQGVAAAMALGAAGVQVGTAYLLCPEATTSAVHRAALKSDGAPASPRSPTCSPAGPLAAS